MLKRNMIRLVIGFGLLLAGSAHASDLLDVYHLALKNDPTYRAAFSELDTQRHALRVAYAALLPTVEVTGSRTLHNDQQTVTSTGPTRNKKDQYGYSISATQSLLDLSSWMTVRQARARLQQAEERAISVFIIGIHQVK